MKNNPPVNRNAEQRPKPDKGVTNDTQDPACPQIPIVSPDEKIAYWFSEAKRHLDQSEKDYEMGCDFLRSYFIQGKLFGEYLNRAQAAVEANGELWLPRLAKEFSPEKIRTCQDWMQIARPENWAIIKPAYDKDDSNFTKDKALAILRGKEPKRKPSNAERKDKELEDKLKEIVADAYPTFRPDELETLHQQFVSGGSALSDDFKAWMDVLMTELRWRARQQNKKLTKEDILKGREQATDGLIMALEEQRDNMRAFDPEYHLCPVDFY